jgi:predicted ATP-grasp superfamily ATP-dependent carboligase
MVRESPSRSLVHEADLMVRALITDLRDIPGVSVVTTRDHRLPVIDAADTLVVDRVQDPLIAFDRCLEQAEAAWVIAPETGGALERLTRRVEESGRPLLGCGSAAVALTASKRATAEALVAAGLAVVPTFAAVDEIPPLPGLWVVKPDDGAGAEDTVRCWDADAAAERMRRGLVAQPWIEGDNLSLSLLCARGDARLLTINRQQIAIEDERLLLRAITVNALRDADGMYARLARRIAAAIPTLFGWVGVDLILTDDGPMILEINPRVTTSYCGLRAARGVNPAALVFNLFQRHELPSVADLPVGTPAQLDLRLSDAG